MCFQSGGRAGLLGLESWSRVHVHMPVERARGPQNSWGRFGVGLPGFEPGTFGPPVNGLELHPIH